MKFFNEKLDMVLFGNWNKLQKFIEISGTKRMGYKQRLLFELDTINCEKDV